MKWTTIIELPADIGDALMAAFTRNLAKHWKRKVYAAVAGQLPYYLPTSGIIALHIGLAVSFSSIGSEANVFQALFKKFSWFAELAFFLPSSVADVSMVWVAIFPVVTLSVVANMLISTIVIAVAWGREKILRCWVECEVPTKDGWWKIG